MSPTTAALIAEAREAPLAYWPADQLVGLVIRLADQLETLARAGSAGRPARSAVRARRPLTKAQARVYAHLAQHIAEHGYAPSLTEIARELGYSSLASVHELLRKLEWKGWIEREPRSSRGIRLLADYNTDLNTASYP